MKKLHLIFALLFITTLQVFGQTLENRTYIFQVRFPSGSAELTPKAQKGLNANLKWIDPELIVQTTLTGHTDHLDDDESNMELGMKRAQSVKAFLISQGYPAHHMQCMTQGESSPYAFGQDVESNAANRRVDLKFVVEPNAEEWKALQYHLLKYPNTIVENTVRPQNTLPVLETATVGTPPAIAPLFEEMQEAPQIFTFNSSRPFSLTGKKGTQMFFTAGSFCDCETSQQVGGEIEIRLQEYYSREDFLISGLSTMSQENWLETAGTIHIEAFQEGKQLCLVRKKSYDISFPIPQEDKGNPKTDMTLFKGTPLPSGDVDWTAAPNRLVNQRTLRNGVSYGRDPGFYRLRFFQRVALYFQSLEEWQAYHQQKPPRGQRGNFMLKRAARKYYEEYKQRYDDFVNGEADITKIDQMIIDNYILSANRLGYINCDRFMRNEEMELVNQTFPIPEDNPNMNIRIIINETNGIMSPYFKNGKWRLDNIPKGYSGKFVAIKMSEENGPELSTFDMTIGEKIPAEKIKFVAYSTKELKDILGNL